jgi:hypothetical protein
LIWGMYQQAKELLGSGEVLVSVLAGISPFSEQRKEKDEKKRDGKRCSNIRLLMAKNTYSTETWAKRSVTGCGRQITVG